MQCAEALRVQAYFDAQLDPLAADQLERHVEHCGECSTLLQELRTIRARLRQDVDFDMAPAGLRERVSAVLDREALARESRPRAAPQPTAAARLAKSFWYGAASGFGAAAAAALLGWFVLMPVRQAPLLDAMVAAHVRSLLPDHLIDVLSSERHTVKPWFAGHADVSPVVVDFEAQGYKLLGGRADYIERQRAAVVVYRHGAHIINVFSWAGDAPSLQSATRNGYHLRFWSVGNLQYCAVSDTGWDELRGLEDLLEARE